MLCIKTSEVIADIKSAAWLESELHPELDRHRRHEMADICEKDNIEKVWRIMGLAEAEIRIALVRVVQQQKCFSHANILSRPGKILFRLLHSLPSATVSFIREKIHEYMVAAVMADRCEVIIRQAAPVWRERAGAALAALRQTAIAAPLPSGPVRRPLWPL
ncbi:MAG: hypothetical protein K2O47_04235 [Muribaculaceae bacterium]|nr:hypothetical protein [Muribaculaceae bacterium]